MKQERHELQFHNMPRNTEENPVDLIIVNEPETLEVDEKLCAELVDVEANPFGGLFEWCSKETSGAACVHADGAHEKSNNPDDHETERPSEWDSRSGDDFWKCGSRWT